MVGGVCEWWVGEGRGSRLRQWSVCMVGGGGCRAGQQAEAVEDDGGAKW